MAQKVRIKLASELVALQSSGGKLLGRTTEGLAVIELTTTTEATEQPETSTLSMSAGAPEHYEPITKLVVIQTAKPPENYETSLQQVGLEIVDRHQTGSFEIMH